MRKFIFGLFVCVLMPRAGYAFDPVISKINNFAMVATSVVPADKQTDVINAYKKIPQKTVTVSDVLDLCDIAFADEVNESEKFTKCMALVDGVLNNMTCQKGGQTVATGGQCPDKFEAVGQILSGVYVRGKNNACVCQPIECNNGFLLVKGQCLQESSILLAADGVVKSCVAAWHKYAPHSHSYEDFSAKFCKTQADLDRQIAQWDKDGVKQLEPISDEDYKSILARAGSGNSIQEYVKSIEDAFYASLRYNQCKTYYNLKDKRIEQVYNNFITQWIKIYNETNGTGEYDQRLARLKSNAIDQVKHSISQQMIMRHASKMQSVVMGVLAKYDLKNFNNMSDNAKNQMLVDIGNNIAKEFNVKPVTVQYEQISSAKGTMINGQYNWRDNVITMNTISPITKTPEGLISVFAHEYSHYIDNSCPEEGALGNQRMLAHRLFNVQPNMKGTENMAKTEQFDTYLHNFSEQAAHVVGWQIERAISSMLH